VTIRWLFSFFNHGRSARLIDAPRPTAPGLVEVGAASRVEE
jgi:hypothetical protein